MVVTFARGDARTIRVALGILKKGAEAAAKANAKVALPTLHADLLTTHVESLTEMLLTSADEVTGDVDLGTDRLEALKLALFLFRQKLDDERDAQIALTIAVEDTDTRIRDVTALQDRLSAQLSLAGVR